MSSTTRPSISGLGRPSHSTSTSSTSTLGSSSSLTSPLKVTKQTTAYASSGDLVGGQKGGAPLARRQSASFNHVRTSSLVSSSPFKTGGDTNSARYGTAAKVQKAPTQLQHSSSPTASGRSSIPTSSNNNVRSRSDENKPIDNVRKPRESKGFQRLPEKEAVSKSPFVEGNGVSPSTRVGYSRSADFVKDFTSGSSADIGRDNARNIVKSTSYPITSALANEPSQAPSLLAPNHSLGTRPLPGTPQKPARPMSMVIPASSTPLTASPIASSPRSNLVNKRLLGPRSPDTSFIDANKRERRKTVTWDERCDVMEFDMESDVTESVQDTEDERRDEEDGSEFEEERVRTPPVTKREETNDFFGPDRESGRSPSPILSGSINDAAEDNEVVEMLSNASAMSDDESATPQKETIPLPEEPYVPQFVDINSFLSNHESFREDSVSTHDDSFTSRLRNEPDETSFRFSESRSPERFPRISRDAIRRQVEQQKMEHSSDNVLTTPSRPRLSTGSPRRSFDGIAERSSPSPFRASFQPSPEPKRAEEVLSSSRSGTQIDDVQSALDKLMLGVEKGFEPSIRSNISNLEDDRMSDGTASDDNSFAPQSYGRYGHGEEERTMVIDAEEEENMTPSDLPVLRESTAMSGADTESTDGPFTPQMHETASLDASPETLHRPMDMDHSFATSKPLPPPPPSDDTFTPPPAVRVLETSDSEDDTPVNPGPAFTLSAPVPSERVIPKRGETIKKREEAIKARRRELRAAEGRPARRRSQSTGDLKAELDEDEKLELAHTPGDEPDLEDQFRSEVAKLEPSKKKYMLKQRRPTIYASDSRVGHLGAAGDVHGGKAWRTVRRPSDMNEYAKQLRQLRNQEKGGNSQGKVFVKVIGIRDLDMPLPSQPTYFSCVLNNGIHFVETPPNRLEHEALIDQEFELIEHEKLEFTLTIKVRKDAHIAKILSPPAPVRPTYAPSRVETPTKSKGGMRSFFSSPAKKPSRPVIKEPEPEPQPIRTTDPFGRYLKKDLSIARALVAFKDIVGHCDCKLFETSYPLVGQVSDGNAVVTKTVGEIVLQIFRLPAIPGVNPNDLPQSLDECHRGLRHVQWHKVVYHEGVLTQLGGDCTTWRRRNMRVMGANLISYNDVTKKPTSTMDLRKVTLVEDDGGKGGEPTIITPPSEAVAEGLNPPKQLRRKRSFNALVGIDHSFRVVFENNTDDEVCFFADTEEEKQRWMEIFGALVGRIPHNPLWAEIIWQRQQELLAG